MVLRVALEVVEVHLFFSVRFALYLPEIILVVHIAADDRYHRSRCHSYLKNIAVNSIVAIFVYRKPADK